MGKERFCCWIDKDELILSFHPVVGFLLKEFESHEDMLSFVFEATNQEHYRVQ